MSSTIDDLPDLKPEQPSRVRVGGTRKDFADAITRETPVRASIIKKNNITLSN
jgi:hypothetical protein